MELEGLLPRLQVPSTCLYPELTEDTSRLRMVPCTAPSAPYTRPTERLSRPPPIQKLGAENHMLQLNI